ncbi:hypothetical protein KD146_13490 [Devosia sp. BSSL-BM10]|uniref:Uncharacterized protein n=1 Tax=Devosia litorisediminis TaxID=2829817 RepID=A0A942I6Q2_9HYPH|nr:hypothetical protein [Devosia litorisediminis]MBS3849712.1 hypothetical protein [Devosia litorisediminis]
MDDFVAEYMRGGLTAANELLLERFPNASDRVAKLEAMESGGKWHVKWHDASDGADDHDDGFLDDYAG